MEPDGKMYEGKLKANKYHGNGVLVSQDGKRF